MPPIGRRALLVGAGGVVAGAAALAAYGAVAGRTVDAARVRPRPRLVLHAWWAAWASVPCLELLMTVEQLHLERREHGLEVLAIAIDGDAETARRFVAERGLTFPLAFDREGSEMVHRAALTILPTVELRDATGTRRVRHDGWRAGDTTVLTRAVDALLG